MSHKIGMFNCLHLGDYSFRALHTEGMWMYAGNLTMYIAHVY